MYTLIGKPTNRAFRVLWMLEELGVEYEIVHAVPRSDELRAVNPSGKSPALKVGDEVILDSFAIIQFLADRHHKFTAAAGTIERARQDSMSAFAIDDLDGVLWNFSKHKYILPEEYRFADMRKATEYDFNRSVAWLEERMDDNLYACGDEFSVPDIIIGHCSGWARNARLKWPDGKLRDYAKRLIARPAYQRAHEIRSNA